MRSEAFLGYVAIDDFEFKFDGQECTTQPEVANPTTTTTPATTAPHETFPGCKFETDACGWFIDGATDMKWYITNTENLTSEGHDSPKNDFEGNFIYVNALKGEENSTTIFATEMKDSPVEGCMEFFFNIYVSKSIRSLLGCQNSNFIFAA